MVITDPGCAWLTASGDGVTRSLVSLLRAHGCWPEPLSSLAAAAAALGGNASSTGGGSGSDAGGGGGSGAGGCGVGGYELDLLTQLRDARCYCVKVRR